MNQVRLCSVVALVSMVFVVCGGAWAAQPSLPDGRYVAVFVSTNGTRVATESVEVKVVGGHFTADLRPQMVGTIKNSSFTGEWEGYKLEGKLEGDGWLGGKYIGRDGFTFSFLCTSNLNDSAAELDGRFQGRWISQPSGGDGRGPTFHMTVDKDGTAQIVTERGMGRLKAVSYGDILVINATEREQLVFKLAGDHLEEMHEGRRDFLVRQKEPSGEAKSVVGAWRGSYGFEGYDMSFNKDKTGWIRMSSMISLPFTWEQAGTKISLTISKDFVKGMAASAELDNEKRPQEITDVKLEYYCDGDRLSSQNDEAGGEAKVLTRLEVPPEDARRRKSMSARFDFTNYLAYKWTRGTDILDANQVTGLMNVLLSSQSDSRGSGVPVSAKPELCVNVTAEDGGKVTQLLVFDGRLVMFNNMRMNDSNVVSRIHQILNKK